MAKACIRCGTTSTPQWRPEVLSGPKVLCNACGVKVLYPIKTRQAKPRNDFSAAAGHQSHSGSIAKRSHQQSSSVSCHGGSLNGNELHSNPALAPDKHKRQKTHSTAGDVMLSPLQKQYLEVERQYDPSGSTIVLWTITDCTIDDTRDFDNVMHAQAFIDECWVFISTDFRDKAAAQAPLAVNHELELLLAAAAHAPEPAYQEGNTTGRHDGMLHEAAAAADQIKLASEPGPSHMPDSPSASRSRQAAASEAAAEAAAKAVDHGAGADCQLTSSRRSHSSIADACLPALSAENHEIPKQAESAVRVPALPHWPRHSKQMANVTTLHGGGKRSRPTPAPCPPPPAGFAVKSPPVSPGGRSFKFALDNEQAQRPLQVVDPARIEMSPRASSWGAAAGSSSTAGQRSDPTAKVEFPPHKPTPALSVSIRPQDLPNPTTQDPCQPHEGSVLLEATGDVADAQQEQPAAHPCTRARGSQEEEPPVAAASDPGTARQPAAGPQTRQAASVGPWLASSASGMASVRDVSARPASHHLPLSWGSRRPRTRSRPRRSDSSMTDLAVAAAAATAEAEQAAASAVARAHTDYDEAASQSDEKPHSKHHPQNGFPHHGLRSRSLPPRAGSVAQQESGFAFKGYPDANEEPQAGTPRRALGRKGGPRSGRNHHRAGALSSNLHKDLGYIGSNFLGVNGVRHGPDFPLRWKAGTWDPLLKKTVYIGSYDTELEAAKAVDSWHVSCGRSPVNFTEPNAQPAITHVWTLKQQPHEQRTRKQRRDEPALSPAAKASKQHPLFTETKSPDRHCMPKPARQVSEDPAVPRQAGSGNDARQPGPWGSGTASPDALETAGSRNEAQLGTVQTSSSPDSSEGYHCHQGGTDPSQQLPLAVNDSQQPAAAEALDMNPVSRSTPETGLQDGSAVQTHPTRNCRGVILLANGKWRAQIKVEGCMQLLGLFDNKEDAAQTYAVARRQKLLMHVS